MTIERMDRTFAKSVAPKIESLQRRLFLKRSLSLGALTLLTGCNASTPDAMDRLLARMSKANDWIQGALFSPTRLAPTYAESDITRPVPFNAYYAEAQAPVIDKATYRLELAGQIGRRQAWTLEDLQKLPQTTQITRHICVEGWSAIGDWTGTKLSDFLKRIGADLSAKYVYFICKEGYTNTIDMPTALHPQTLMVFKFGNEILPRKYGYPMKIRMPTKLGYKNPKHVTALVVTNEDRGGYWEDQGYNWFGGS